MSPDAAMHRIDALLAHVWVVRTFVKHSEEAEEDEELMEVVRDLYDYLLALGPAWKEKNSAEYLKLAGRKYSKLRAATERFAELQPEVSTHTNYQMAVRSLRTAVEDVGRVLDSVAAGDQA